MNYQDYFNIVDIAYKNSFINEQQKQEIFDVVKHFLARKQKIPLVQILKRYGVTEQQLYQIREQREKLFRETVMTPEKKREIEKEQELAKSLSFSQTVSTGVGNEIGGYKIVKLLGAGAMGSVFLATDNNGKKIAVKTMLAAVAESKTGLKRFYQEANTMKILRHRGIIKIFDVGEDQGTHYFTMEYIDGKPLSDYTAEKMSSLKIAEIIEKVARALSYAHSKNVIHRDIKPGNIMMTGDDEPIIMDFGLAHQVQNNNRLTKTGTMLGTLAYMPPEQVQGNKRDIDGQTDVYALGATLYEMLTGKLPFVGPQLAVLRKIITEEPIPPRETNHLVPEALERICLKAMAKKKEYRFASALEMAEDLERFIGGEKIEARLDKAVISKKGKQNLLIISCVTAFLVLMITVNVLVSSSKPKVDISAHEKELATLQGNIDKSRERTNQFARQVEEMRVKYEGSLGLVEQVLQTLKENIKTPETEAELYCKSRTVTILSDLKTFYVLHKRWREEDLSTLSEGLRYILSKSYKEKEQLLKVDMVKTVWLASISVITREDFSDEMKIPFIDYFLEVSYNYTPLERDDISREIVKEYGALVEKSNFYTFLIAKKRIRNQKKLNGKDLKKLTVDLNNLPEHSYKYYLIADHYDEIYKKSRNYKDRQRSANSMLDALKLNPGNPSYLQEIAKFYNTLNKVKKQEYLDECSIIRKQYIRVMPIFTKVKVR